jgi:hypothetical protein
MLKIQIMIFKSFKTILATLVLLLLSQTGFSQYKEYKLNAKGDTINAINQKGQKQGKWVVSFEELRGEPGYEEEGIYKNGEKDGYWRRYSLQGDLIAVEHYKLGGKDGLQQYYTYLGELEREETWRGYNPDAPYDTVAVYGTGSNEIVEYKIVKAAPYAVKNGPWRYYEGGRLIRTEEWDRNNLIDPNASKPVVAKTESDKPKKVEKTAEMIEWERKNKGKKNAIRDGKTGL